MTRAQKFSLKTPPDILRCPAEGQHQKIKTYFSPLDILLQPGLCRVVFKNSPRGACGARALKPGGGDSRSLDGSPTRPPPAQDRHGVPHAERAAGAGPAAALAASFASPAAAPPLLTAFPLALLFCPPASSCRKARRRPPSRAGGARFGEAKIEGQRPKTLEAGRRSVSITAGQASN